MDVRDNKLYIGEIGCEELIAEYGSPLYVYDKAVMAERYKELSEKIDFSRLRILYACKANTNVTIMKTFRKLGAGLDAVSPGEVFLGLKAGFKPEDILYTGNNSTEDDILYCLKNGVMVNIGSLCQMDIYGTIAPETDISVRINPDVGSGFHDHAITGGPESKFGIYFDRAEEIKEKALLYKLNIVGVHSHIGSGILDIETYLKAMKITMDVAEKFEGLEFIDFGGGIGVPYRPADKRIDMEELGKTVGELFRDFCSRYGRDLTLTLEPGRYLVAESGCLLVTASNRKDTPNHTFIGTDSGFNHLIRPMAYGAFHEIVNASHVEGEEESVAVCGNLCESGDVFTRNEHGIVDRKISRIKNGDVLAILNSGAYGFSMSSNYNSRLLPAEVLIQNGEHRIIRKRQELQDLLRGQSL